MPLVLNYKFYELDEFVSLILRIDLIFRISFCLCETVVAGYSFLIGAKIGEGVDARGFSLIIIM